MPQQLSFSRPVMLLKILAIKFVLFYFCSFGLAFPTVALFSLLLAISQFRSLTLLMRFGVKSRTIIARCFWNLIPLIIYLLHGILIAHLLFFSQKDGAHRSSNRSNKRKWDSSGMCDISVRDFPVKEGTSKRCLWISVVGCQIWSKRSLSLPLWLALRSCRGFLLWSPLIGQLSYLQVS